MDKPTLWVMVGVSASGKSTIAKKIAEKDNCIIVSSDDIRGEICNGDITDQTKNEEVFKIFNKRIKEYLTNGQNVIADATSLTMKSRRGILQNIRKIDCYKIAYIVPKTIENCLKDNKEREYPVPDGVIRKQVLRFQIPFYEEGFDAIGINELSQDCRVDIYELEKRMEGFNQNNPHHTMDLYDHCRHTSWLFATKYPCWSYCLYSAYIHDIGKLFTQTFDEDGIAHYYQHENIGAYYMLCSYDSVYDFENDILNSCFLINYHMLPMNWNTEKAKNKWRKIFGDFKYKLLMDFHECDIAR